MLEDGEEGPPAYSGIRGGLDGPFCKRLDQCPADNGASAQLGVWARSGSWPSSWWDLGHDHFVVDIGEVV